MVDKHNESIEIINHAVNRGAHRCFKEALKPETSKAEVKNGGAKIMEGETTGLCAIQTGQLGGGLV